MNVESAKRVVALCRQASGYAAMARKGLITEQESSDLISACNAEIAAIRAQAELPLPGAEAKPKGRTS